MKTIAAISTAPAVGGIGVIRISGENALSVADKVFSGLSDKRPLQQKEGYTASFGFVHDRQGNKVDECVALVFKAPHSYTGEDVAELSCHGGIFLLQKVLEVVLAAGAVPAEAGEFTKRAFLNKKIDLTQAEAVASLIAAQSDISAAAAMSAKQGALYQTIEKTVHSLVAFSAHLAAWTDYPDEDILTPQTDDLRESLCLAKEQCEALLATFEAGQVISEGIETTIAGRTNAGKSTLMNLLCGTQKSIVTDIEGTTRDIVETTVRVGNAVLRLSDTAGLRESEDTIEKIGITLSKQRIESAGLILAVFDASKPLSEDDFALLEAIKNKKAILVYNKTDLSSVWESEKLQEYKKPLVLLSAKQRSGYEQLVRTVEEVLGTADINPYAPMLATQRQKKCTMVARDCLAEAIEAMDEGFTLDAVNVSLDAALEAFLELTGERVTQKVTDEIFKNFCVGK